MGTRKGACYLYDNKVENLVRRWISYFTSSVGFPFPSCALDMGYIMEQQSFCRLHFFERFLLG